MEVRLRDIHGLTIIQYKEIQHYPTETESVYVVKEMPALLSESTDVMQLCTLSDPPKCKLYKVGCDSGNCCTERKQNRPATEIAVKRGGSM